MRKVGGNVPLFNGVARIGQWFHCKVKNNTRTDKQKTDDLSTLKKMLLRYFLFRKALPRGSTKLTAIHQEGFLILFSIFKGIVSKRFYVLLFVENCFFLKKDLLCRRTILFINVHCHAKTEGKSCSGST